MPGRLDRDLPLKPMAFRFKQFLVEDDQSSMRVGTDAVLLGTWADIVNQQQILEIGTGCGVISLILAQRSSAFIDAIDIDEKSVEQAGRNFRESSWNQRLKVFHTSLQEFRKTSKRKYDHILTNPPYYCNSLKSPDVKKNKTRHEDFLNHEELLDGIIHFLKIDGKASLILPFKESQRFVELASDRKLFLARKMEIIPRKKKNVNRVLMEFSLDTRNSISSESLTIRDEEGDYTKEYRAFTRPYYFSLK